MSNRIIPVVPGLLISMRTSIKGGVHYRREDLVDEIEGEGVRKEWKTEKRVDNAEEYTQARRLRGRIGTLIGGACVKTAFTYICPLDKEQVLNEKIAEAQAACDAFNATATYSHVSFDLMRGRYTEDTRETVQAVRREIHELMAELNAAMATGEIKDIRDVAAKATQMGRLLEEGSEARTALERAVKESRRVATQLVKRIEEGAEAVAEVLAGANVSLIATARHTFSDDEMGEIDEAAPAMPAVALEQFDDLGADYVEPPAPEPVAEEQADPQPSPGMVAGNALGVMLAEALVQFGEYSYDDKGPEEVMDMGAALSLVEALEPAEVLVAFGVLEQQHGDRGGVLVEALTEVLPEDTMDALDALSQGDGATAQEEPAGVVVPLTNAAALITGAALLGAQAGGATPGQLAEIEADLPGIIEQAAGADSFDDDDLGEI